MDWAHVGYVGLGALVGVCVAVLGLSLCIVAGRDVASS
jgi:hypothetical protein